MESLFQFNEYEVLTFGAVFVRYGAFFSMLPFFGHQSVPGIIRVLFSLACTVCVFPMLLHKGYVDPKMAIHWSSTTEMFLKTLAGEVLFGVCVSFVAKLLFDVITMAGSFMATAMGYAMATTYDPHFEGQSVSLAELQAILATLVFLSVDGHHQILVAALKSYQYCSLGGFSVEEAFSQRLIEMTRDVLILSIQLSAPILLSMFGVNVIFGIFSRAMPQVNVLMLSLSVTGILGLIVLYLVQNDMQSASGQVLAKTSDWMYESMRLLGR